VLGLIIDAKKASNVCGNIKGNTMMIKKYLRDRPRHDWTSHGADAFRYLSIVWKDEESPILKDSRIKGFMLAKLK